MKSKTRPYRMGARAAAAERTGERILDAMLERFGRLPYDQVRLEDVAADAGVTVQTVIRRFGGKPGTLAATVERQFGRLVSAREAAKGATVEETVHALVGFYEEAGRLILKLYAEARLAPGVPELAQRGRDYHVAWCRETFGDLVGSTDAAMRKRRLAQVVAICDATTWRILREDGGLGVRATERALLEMLEPVLA
ncbi:AcrR family transcriptional regulator [Nocardioides thalensis]|uniref:AcrR family transcriptional regulator n=1 Tax=Nocardioides thalensis TaxID=1914755 RepID=A0A853C5Q4_9ACTN|nr:TetR/AcrR family transcriptional regulator [Nocardioides thalensis]NYJ02346.1 AcrR family transcriptional regulator [Nocardioides thalensis]